MAELLPKDKAALALIYEMDEFKSFQKLCNSHIADIAEKLLVLDMSTPGTERVVTFLQGQALALKNIQLEMKKIHKNNMKIES